MGDDVHERVSDRAQISLRQRRAVMTGMVVQRGEDDVEAGELVIAEVEGTVVHDVHFDPVEHLHALEARADLRELAQNGNNIVLDQMKSRLNVLQKLQAASEENLRLEEDEFARVQQLAERGVVPASQIVEARRGRGG